MATATQTKNTKTNRKTTTTKSSADAAPSPRSRAAIGPLRPSGPRAGPRALHDTLTAQVQALTVTGKWAAFLRFADSAHTYSLSNLLLMTVRTHRVKPETPTG